MTTVTSQTTSELLRHVQDVHGTDETADLWPLVLKLPEAVVAGGPDALR